MDRNEKRTYCKTRLFQYREILTSTNEVPFTVKMEKWNINWDGNSLKIFDGETLLADAQEQSIDLAESVSEFFHFPLDLFEVMIDKNRLPCYN